MLIDIQIEAIQEHPDNPRKELGDLKELTESIKKNGILQNLTVVQEGQDSYKVVIGHRRLAAAKRAGLKTVPCVIREMSQREQIQTMLMENIQREDLTVYEQAQGFQMMMDLGSTVADIVKETGFSETTVRHRLKMTELNQETLKEKAKNISIKELIELEKIKDTEERNKVLEAVGTNNFEYNMQRAIREQEKKEKEQAIREEMAGVAEEIEDTQEWRLLHTNYSYHDAEHQKSKEEIFEGKTGPFAFRICSWGTEYFEKKPEQEAQEEQEKREKDEEAQRRRKERLEKLGDIKRTMYDLRLRFAKFIPIKKCAENRKLIERKAGELLATYNTSWRQDDNLEKIWDWKEPETEEDQQDAWERFIEEKLKKYPETALFQIVYASMEEGEEGVYDDTYRKNNKLCKLYDFLEMFGYETGDEEKAILDGTHELYQKVTQENGKR